jgi:hypothetical protein
MLKSLLSFKQEAYTSSVPDLTVLLQQMYVSMIAQYCSLNEWDRAGKLLVEAFQSIPAALHKPIWRLRMILMSKQGKDIESEIIFDVSCVHYLVQLVSIRY